jgi:hypothetical protein
MAERRRLRDIELAGGRALFRRVLFAGLLGFVVLGLVGYNLPAHRLRGDADFHANYADGGVASMLVFLAVAGLVVLAWRWRRWGAGFLAGGVATVGAVGALLPVMLAHFLSSVDNTYGEAVFAIGVLGLFFAGIATAILEPILFIGQRRALERGGLPEARVFT